MRLGFSIFALLSWLVAVPAQAVPYAVDKSHAHIAFMVSHLGFSMVHGQFREFDAQIDFDPGNVEATRLRFVVQTASVETFWEARDRDLRGKNFLNTDVYPTMMFDSSSVVPTGPNTAEVNGNLTLLGVTKPVTFQARLNKIGPSPFDPSLTVAGFSVTGQLDRRDWGMGFAAPAVGAIVDIRIDLEMSPVR